MKRCMLWTLAAVLCAAGGGLIIWAALDERSGRPRPPQSQPTPDVAASQPISFDDEGYTVITLEPTAAHRLGIQSRQLAVTKRQPEVTANGVLQQDPSRVYTVRAPAPGLLRASELVRWPSPGDLLSQGLIIGWLEPRSGAQSAPATAAAGDEADESVASRPADTGANRSPESTALTLEVGGKVIEMAAQPGETVSNGQPILRLIRWDRLLARVVLAPGATGVGPVDTARLVVSGQDDWLLQGSRIPLASSTDAATGGQVFLFAVLAGDLPLEPGLPVSVYLPLSGPSVEGVLVPRSALVRHAGHMWLYVQSGPTSYTRFPAPAGILVGGDWFVSGGDLLGKRLVVAGTANLLAEELRLVPPDDDDRGSTP